MYTTELLPYAKGSKTALIKLIFGETTYSFDAYSTGFIDSVTNRSKGGIHLKNEVKPFGFTSRLCMRGVSEKFKLVANRYNMRTVFKQNISLEILL